MADISVRRAKIEEASVLTDLAMRAKASWGYDDAFMALCRDELTLTHEKMETWTIWVAICDEQIAGMIALSQRGDTAELEDFMVEPAFQGRGVGGALMTALLDECRALGLRTVGLDADPNAEPIYRKLGFVTVGRSPSRSIPGRTLPRMTRNL